MPINRESGFYWVKQDGEWSVGEWSPEFGGWFLIADDRAHDDSEFECIAEAMLLPPTKHGGKAKMNALVIWQAPKVLIHVGRVGNMFICEPDDTQAPYTTTRLALRTCANGTLQLYAARTMFGFNDNWHALVLRPADGGQERYWFYRDEQACRSVYETWAGHGDPDGFDYNHAMYAYSYH